MPKSEPAKVVMSGKLVAKIFLIAVGGGSVKSRSINVDINLGEAIPVGNKKRFPIRFNSNSNNSDYGMGSDFRNSCWTGKGLIMEVGEKSHGIIIKVDQTFLSGFHGGELIQVASPIWAVTQSPR